MLKLAAPLFKSRTATTFTSNPEKGKDGEKSLVRKRNLGRTWQTAWSQCDSFLQVPCKWDCVGGMAKEKKVGPKHCCLWAPLPSQLPLQTTSQGVFVSGRNHCMSVVIWVTAKGFGMSGRHRLVISANKQRGHLKSCWRGMGGQCSGFHLWNSSSERNAAVFICEVWLVQSVSLTHLKPLFDQLWTGKCSFLCLF